MSLYPPGRCSSCDAPVIWALTTNGKKIPIDFEPALDGNIVLRRRTDGALIALVPGPATVGLEDFHDERRKSHFATCPNAKRHRKAKP